MSFLLHDTGCIFLRFHKPHGSAPPALSHGSSPVPAPHIFAVLPLPFQTEQTISEVLPLLQAPLPYWSGHIPLPYMRSLRSQVPFSSSYRELPICPQNQQVLPSDLLQSVSSTAAFLSEVHMFQVSGSGQPQSGTASLKSQFLYLFPACGYPVLSQYSDTFLY